MWEQSSTEIEKMTVKQFLDMLTDWNWHTERCLIETIIDGRKLERTQSNLRRARERDRLK